VKVWHPKLKATESAIKVVGATQADFTIAR
jgi:hypothetical protein